MRHLLVPNSDDLAEVGHDLRTMFLYGLITYLHVFCATGGVCGRVPDSSPTCS